MTTTGEPTSAEPLAPCRSGRGWLLGAGHGALGRPGARARDALRALLGAAICERAAGDPACRYPSADLRLLARHVRRCLEAEHDRGSFRPPEHDPKLLLLGQRVLSECGVPSPVLGRHARALATALGSRPAAQTAGCMAGERLLLAALGHLDPAPPPAWPVTPSFDEVVTAGLPEIQAICGHVAACTGYGTAGDAVPGHGTATDGLCAGLMVVMLDALRRYDLVTGALLLRTLCYLRAQGGRAVRCAVSFLLAQQRPDGRFGYLAMEAGRVRAELNLDPDAELYLPMTVACLWALAEVLAGLRLFGPPARR